MFFKNLEIESWKSIENTLLNGGENLMEESYLELEEIEQLKKTKQKIACYVEKILKEKFPKNYKKNSRTKISIDLTSNPIGIITITDNDITTEGKIGKVELNLEAEGEEYFITPIITIWTTPLKKPINIKVLRNK